MFKPLILTLSAISAYGFNAQNVMNDPLFLSGPFDMTLHNPGRYSLICRPHGKASFVKASDGSVKLQFDQWVGYCKFIDSKDYAIGPIIDAGRAMTFSNINKEFDYTLGHNPFDGASLTVSEISSISQSVNTNDGTQTFSWDANFELSNLILSNRNYNYYITFTRTEKIQCSSNEYLSGATCISCPSTCKTCTSSYECTSCKTEFSLPAYGGVCRTCASNEINQSQRCYVCPANQISKDNKCQSCPSGQIIQYNECQACASNEISMNNQCQACPAGYITKDNQCIACAGNQVSKNNMCDTCAKNQIKKDNQCQTCPAGQISKNNECQACPVGQVSKDNQCQACKPNQITKDNQCFTCAKNQIRKDNQCTTCAKNEISKDNQCQTCQPHQIVKDNECYTCPAGQVSKDNLCQACKSNQFVEANACKACPEGCATCDAKACLKCSKNYKLMDKKCVSQEFLSM